VTETDPVFDAIQGLSEALGQPGALLTAYVLVCEWADQERDERRLTQHTSESLTDWSADGMLQHALDKDWGEE
jgi:hypothetical protein